MIICNYSNPPMIGDICNYYKGVIIEDIMGVVLMEISQDDF